MNKPTEHMQPRRITSHAVNPANERLAVLALDGPGSGGASHAYAIDGFSPQANLGRRSYEAYCAGVGGRSFNGDALPTWEALTEAALTDPKKARIVTAWNMAAAAAPIVFQNGPIAEAGVNGVTHEALLAIVADRLNGFQSGHYTCKENGLALKLLSEAIGWLHIRTTKRMERGVEGTHTV